MTIAARLAGLLTVVTILSALCPNVSAEEELGRLFFTPERRQILDRQRQLNIQEKQEVVEDPTLTINGIVTRNSGQRTVWINGVAQSDNETQSGVSVTPQQRDAGRVVVKTTEATSTNAKVGDTVNRNTGEATDLLGDGRIKVRPAIKARPVPNEK